VYCKAKNKPRLFELLNRIVHLYEVHNKREDFFLEPVIIEKPVYKTETTYTFLEKSERHGNDFKSLIDCVQTGDCETLKKHFGR
jgi:hypothetical protein